MIMRALAALLALTLVTTFALPVLSAESTQARRERLTREAIQLPRQAEAALKEKVERRIARLKEHPNRLHAKWWNELAAAHIRLGDPATAASILESAVKSFPDDYGVHANLGTAYHLLGRYSKAAQHIQRDLEIDPNAHFGLEPFHLALLQHLMLDEADRRHRLYVDEYSLALLDPSGMGLSFQLSEDEVLRDLAAEHFVRDLAGEHARGSSPNADGTWDTVARVLASRPPYRDHWDLAAHPKFDAGVLYMAKLNRSEPAAITMLGVASLRKGDLNLAVKAFERAIALGAPQRDHLEAWIRAVSAHIAESRMN